MKEMKKQVAIGLLAFMLLGCESPALLVHKDDAAYAPPEDFAMPDTHVRGGGVYNSGYNWSLIQDRRAYRIGDILTVKLDESTQASKQARTNFGKKNDVSLGIPEAFGHSVDKLSGSVDGNQRAGF